MWKAREDNMESTSYHSGSLQKHMLIALLHQNHRKSTRMIHCIFVQPVDAFNTSAHHLDNFNICFYQSGSWFLRSEHSFKKEKTSQEQTSIHNTIPNLALTSPFVMQSSPPLPMHTLLRLITPVSSFPTPCLLLLLHSLLPSPISAYIHISMPSS